MKHIDLHEFCGSAKSLKAFQIAFASKNPEESKSSDHICLSQCQVIKQEIETFSKTCPERSEICALREKYGVISGPYFLVFGLKTGKYRPEKTPYLDTFHTMVDIGMAS